MTDQAQDELTDDQFATLMDAVEIARSCAVRHLATLKARLTEMGHRDCDVGPALAYWATYERSIQNLA
jgi:hypothetical protein